MIVCECVCVWACLVSTFRWTCVHLTFLFLRYCAFYSQGYFYNDDTFNFNYAQAKAALGNYKEAEEVIFLYLHTCYVLIFITSGELPTVAFRLLLLSLFSGLSADSEWKDRSRTTMFTSAGWHDAVCIVVVLWRHIYSCSTIHTHVHQFNMHFKWKGIGTFKELIK